MRFSVIILLLLGVCSALATPADGNALVSRQRRQVDIFANTKHLIEELIANLRAAANDALEAVNTFEYGLVEQAKLIREKLLNDLQKLKDRVAQVIQGVADKITGSGEAVKQCIEDRRNDANALFNDTLSKALDCADERIAEIGIQIENLKNYSNEGLAFADSALEEMQKCVDDNPGSIFSVGSCLGSVAIKTEAKGAIFITQSAISIARLNLGLATIPAALEVCVGSHLVSAGLVTGKIVVQIGSCSASSVFTTIIGNTV